jgi:hypothetical protein
MTRDSAPEPADQHPLRMMQSMADAGRAQLAFEQSSEIFLDSIIIIIIHCCSPQDWMRTYAFIYIY